MFDACGRLVDMHMQANITSDLDLDLGAVEYDFDKERKDECVL